MRLVSGEEKTLKLANWTGGEWFGRPGINFEVMEEDGKPTEGKQFTITSRRLIALLKPIILEAEQEEWSALTVRILRSGEGMNTRYRVIPVPDDEKATRLEK